MALDTKVAMIMLKMRPLIQQEYNVNLELHMQNAPAIFMVYALKSRRAELPPLADELENAMPSLAMAADLVPFIDRIVMGFSPDSIVFQRQRNKR